MFLSEHKLPINHPTYMLVDQNLFHHGNLDVFSGMLYLIKPNQWSCSFGDPAKEKKMRLLELDRELMKAPYFVPRL